MWSNQNFHPLLAKCNLLYSFGQAVWFYLVKVKWCISHDLAILFLAIILDKLLHMLQQDTKKNVIKSTACKARKIETNVYQW